VVRGGRVRGGRVRFVVCVIIINVFLVSTYVRAVLINVFNVNLSVIPNLMINIMRIIVVDPGIDVIFTVMAIIIAINFLLKI
jgi:hypothetical protein